VTRTLEPRELGRCRRFARPRRRICSVVVGRCLVCRLRHDLPKSPTRIPSAGRAVPAGLSQSDSVADAARLAAHSAAAARCVAPSALLYSRCLRWRRYLSMVCSNQNVGANGASLVRPSGGGKFFRRDLAIDVLARPRNTFFRQVSPQQHFQGSTRGHERFRHAAERKDARSVLRQNLLAPKALWFYKKSVFRRFYENRVFRIIARRPIPLLPFS
jgi:hypothetical protein